MTHVDIILVRLAMARGAWWGEEATSDSASSTTAALSGWGQARVSGAWVVVVTGAVVVVGVLVVVAVGVVVVVSRGELAATGATTRSDARVAPRATLGEARSRRTRGSLIAAE